MDIVVFCPNLIGDTVMATPALRSLRAGFPDARIHAVAKPFVTPVLDGLDSVDHVIPHDRKSEKIEFQTGAVVQELKSIHADIAVLFPNSFRSALLAWKGRAVRRVGFARGGRGLFLTDRLTPPNRIRHGYAPMPVVEYYMKIVQYLNCPDMGRELEQMTTAADENAADNVFSKWNLNQARPLIVFNTGGAFGPAKNWPVSHFAQLAKMLLKEISTAQIVVICGPSEVSNARAITELAGDPRVVSLADEPQSVGLSKAIIRRSELVVTTDSGPRHFATAFQRPTVSLFGPTHMEWTRTMHPLAIHLQKSVECGPCQKGICPEKHHQCMVELLPEQVLDSCLSLLGRNRIGAGPRRSMRETFRVFNG
ncbi:MAG: ADP-heptose--LPS heptosyltransferase 2 [Planctomycetota bacterium]|jgi:heptosyltransferase-2